MSKAVPIKRDIRHTSVDPAWVDLYGHMNMAYYVKIFDDACHDMLSAYGLGAAYTQAHGFGLFTVDARIAYRREVTAGAPLEIRLRIVKADAKRLWTSLEMRHTEQDYLAATLEQLAINVSLATRKAAPFPAHLDDILVPYRS
ncbi:thioesterase family protein [Ancylobacter sonchi]|uniref:thioesterase family protein n=1 Tax=Ancylobacter sonchi TaxID=1937790 RepID=UPI001BD330BF|nr:thioesterase family protein [Ancylobacter sonchi]MBS7534760.1 thioesterase family protein [Ancylobacter sonchi]